jgi:hypothetical protein
MRVIDTVPNSGAILKPRFWSQHDYQREDGTLDRKYRYEVKSYMDYCALGTLQDLIAQYGAAQWQQDSDEYVKSPVTPNYPYNNHLSQIPEAMLWLILRTLSEAIYKMEVSLTYVPGVAASAEAPGWLAKVHRDIKTSATAIGRSVTTINQPPLDTPLSNRTY